MVRIATVLPHATSETQAESKAVQFAELVLSKLSRYVPREKAPTNNFERNLLTALGAPTGCAIVPSDVNRNAEPFESVDWARVSVLRSASALKVSVDRCKQKLR